jgi:tetratricopeptide (TPR) repeat protein
VTLESLKQEAEALIERDRYPQARERLAEAYRMAPDDSEIHLLGTIIFYMTDEYDQAKSQCSRLLASEPDSRPGRLLMARIQGKLGELGDAEEILLGCIRDEPQDPEGFVAYAEVALAGHEHERARLLVDEALRLAPSLRAARVLDLLLAVVEQRVEQVADRLEALLRDEPEALSSLYALVIHLAEDGRNAEALEVARFIVRSTPTDPDAIDLVVRLAVRSHWLMVPLWPITRFGMVGSGIAWMTAVGCMLAARSQPIILGTVISLYLGYVVYSWVMPGWLHRWMVKHGV